MDRWIKLLKKVVVKNSTCPGLWRILGCVVAGLIFVAVADAALVTYPGPSGISASTLFSLTVNAQPVFVYETNVNLQTTWPQSQPPEKAGVAYFDFSGSVSVTVTVLYTTVTSVTIRPASAGVSASISGGNQITFTLSSPQKLSIEINGSLSHPLLLFANGIEQNPPSPGDPGVIYYGPGLQNIGAVNIGSNQTVYIAGGAVVRGKFSCSGSTMKVMGRGILDGSQDNTAGAHMFYIDDNSSNITLQGIIIFDSPSWTCMIVGSTGVTATDIKIVNWRGGSDGFDICGCTNVTISDCFIRNWDDGIAIKSVYVSNRKRTTTVTVTKCIFWHDYGFAPMEIGNELQTDLVSGITFQDCDIIHARVNAGNGGAITIQNGDAATVNDVLYDNVRIEDATSNYLINLFIGVDQWSKDATRGNINGVTFRNMKISGNYPGSMMQGYDATHLIQNITFDRCRNDAGYIRNAGDLKLTIGNYVSNVVFIADTTPVVAVPTISPNGGTFADSVRVTLSTSTSGATIYYTTNGSDPTTFSTPYSNPFNLTGTATVKAKAFKGGMTESGIASATFTITTGSIST